MHKSRLQENPKSKVLKRGYINIYSKLTSQETRQIFYKTLYKKNNPDWDDGMVYLSKYLDKILTPKSNLLDIGCGNGNYLIDENRKKIPCAIGIDVNRAVTSKNICLDKIVYGKVENLPFADKTFDIALSLWVFEHLENPETSVSEICRVLIRGGMLFFITPNYDFLPLKILCFIKLSKINWLLNRKLFGREKEDIFKTYYKANTLSKIKTLSEKYFNVKILKTNYDPSYTSFNFITYKISILIEKALHLVALEKYWHPHIIGVLIKK